MSFFVEGGLHFGLEVSPGGSLTVDMLEGFDGSSSGKMQILNANMTGK